MSNTNPHVLYDHCTSSTKSLTLTLNPGTYAKVELSGALITQSTPVVVYKELAGKWEPMSTLSGPTSFCLAGSECYFLDFRGIPTEPCTELCVSVVVLNGECPAGEELVSDDECEKITSCSSIVGAMSSDTCTPVVVMKTECGDLLYKAVSPDGGFIDIDESMIVPAVESPLLVRAVSVCGQVTLTVEEIFQLATGKSLSDITVLQEFSVNVLEPGTKTPDATATQKGYVDVTWPETGHITKHFSCTSVTIAEGATKSELEALATATLAIDAGVCAMITVKYR